VTEVQNYTSTMEDPDSRRFETFSYLPAMAAQDIRRQIAHAVAQGWNSAIEHAEPERATETYWYMWKLPMFGEQDVDSLREVDACHRAYPGHHVRFVAYDRAKQSQGMSFVIYRA